MDLDPLKPQSYPSRCLLLVTGLSPQVVTETVYALAVKAQPSFVPTEVHLVTTARGREHARLNLLSDEPGWFHRLCSDYGLAGLRFDEEAICVINDSQGAPLEDIRTEEDNIRTADLIVERVRELTRDPQCALHVSIAGGRKTMGFYAGYALSLYGRPQDRLSHVLVTPPFEGHPEFYYPTPRRRVIHTLDSAHQPLDTSTAQVVLAEIPFVRLRHGLDERLKSGSASYSEAVAAAQRALGPAKLVVDLAARLAICGGQPVSMSPANLAFYAWLARRRRDGRGPVRWTDEGVASELLDALLDFVPEMSAIYERMSAALGKGMTKEYFDQRKSRANDALRKVLGAGAAPYLLAGQGGRPRTRFGLTLPPEAISFVPALDRPSVDGAGGTQSDSGAPATATGLGTDSRSETVAVLQDTSCPHGPRTDEA